MLDHFGQAARVRPHHGNPRGHGGEGGETERLVVGRQQEDIGLGQRLVAFDAGEELHRRGEPHRACEFARHRALRAVADQKQIAGNLTADALIGLQHHIDALARAEVREVQDRGPVGRPCLECAGHRIQEVGNHMDLPRAEFLDHDPLERVGHAGDRVGAVESMTRESEEAQVGLDEGQFDAVERGHKLRLLAGHDPAGQRRGDGVGNGGMNVEEIELRVLGHRRDLGREGEVVHGRIGGRTRGRIDDVLAHAFFGEIRRSRAMADEVDLMTAAREVAGERRRDHHRRGAQGRSDHSDLHIGST